MRSGVPQKRSITLSKHYKQGNPYQPPYLGSSPRKIAKKGARKREKGDRKKLWTGGPQFYKALNKILCDHMIDMLVGKLKDL